MPTIESSLLTHVCTISRNTPGSANAIGFKAESFAAVETDTQCHFEDKGQQIRAGRFTTSLENPRLFLVPTSGITKGDRVTAIKTAASGGTTIDAGTFRVISVRDFYLDDDKHHIEAELERVD